MQKYRSTANSKVRVDYGIELVQGLQMFPETTELAAQLAAQNESLDGLRLAREQRERELVPVRARVRFGNYAFDQAVRAASRGAEIHDGGTRGILYRANFADKLTAVVAPTGKAQVPVGAAFIARVKASNASGVQVWRSEWMGKIETAFASLASACEDRDKANGALAEARVVEEAAREDHELLIDKLMGEVRAIFPKDRNRWSVIFPSVTRSSADEDESDTPEPEPTPNA